MWPLSPSTLTSIATWCDRAASKGTALPRSQVERTAASPPFSLLPFYPFVHSLPHAFNFNVAVGLDRSRFWQACRRHIHCLFMFDIAALSQYHCYRLLYELVCNLLFLLTIRIFQNPHRDEKDHSRSSPFLMIAPFHNILLHSSAYLRTPTLPTINKRCYVRRWISLRWDRCRSLLLFFLLWFICDEN
jgi:hypothetical protein